MEIMMKSNGLENDRNLNLSATATEQYKKAANEMAERKEVKAQEGMGKQQETTYDRVSHDGDTLSISKAGKMASSAIHNKPADKNTEDGVVICRKAEESSQKQEEEVSTINLSGYTEFELKQMYLDGDITRSEYDEELGSRGAAYHPAHVEQAAVPAGGRAGG